MAERVWCEKDLFRCANRRLAVLRHAEEVGGNVAATCRYCGISRTMFYRWKRRYENEGSDGLKDRSSAPLQCSTITPPGVIEKIIHLRQHYHFGPLKIEMYLRHYRDQEISHSTIYRILKRLRYEPAAVISALQTSPAVVEAIWQQRPGHQLQIDGEFVEPTTTDAGRKSYYQYTATGDCIRLRILRIYPRSDQKTAIQFTDYVLSRCRSRSRTSGLTTVRSSSQRAIGTCRTRHRACLPPPGDAAAQWQGRGCASSSPEVALRCL